MARILDTTFDYPEWTQGDGLGDAVCSGAVDGIACYGSWRAKINDIEQIPEGEDQFTSAANMAAGSGGRGFRHKFGDGTNNVGGALQIAFSARAELWLRWYVRLPVGMAFVDPDASNGFKMVYFGSGEYFGMHQGLLGGHAGQTNQDFFSALDWRDWQGGPTGDGLWHCFEIHVKKNNPGASANGIFEMWLDDVQIYSNTGVRLTTGDNQTFDGFRFGENSGNHNQGATISWMDFDDLAVDDAQRVGLLSGGGGAPEFNGRRGARMIGLVPR